jgi:hypothetical protein
MQLSATSGATSRSLLETLTERVQTGREYTGNATLPRTGGAAAKGTS